jgi:hypothetical protein
LATAITHGTFFSEPRGSVTHSYIIVHVTFNVSLPGPGPVCGIHGGYKCSDLHSQRKQKGGTGMNGRSVMSQAVDADNERALSNAMAMGCTIRSTAGSKMKLTTVEETEIRNLTRY